MSDCSGPTKTSKNLLSKYSWFRWKLRLTDRYEISHKNAFSRGKVCVDEKWIMQNGPIDLFVFGDGNNSSLRNSCFHFLSPTAYNWMRKALSDGKSLFRLLFEELLDDFQEKFDTGTYFYDCMTIQTISKSVSFIWWSVTYAILIPIRIRANSSWVLCFRTLLIEGWPLANHTEDLSRLESKWHEKILVVRLKPRVGEEGGAEPFLAPPLLDYATNRD